MGKWDGKRQAARRASRPQGAASAVADRPGSAGGRTALRAGSSLLRKFWSRESAGFPARQGAGEGRCRGQAKRGRAAAPGKSNAKWRACSLLGLGLLQGEGRPKGASAPAEAGGFAAEAVLGGRPALRRPGRAEIQRKYRVTSAPGPADGQVASRLCCSCAR